MILYLLSVRYNLRLWSDEGKQDLHSSPQLDNVEVHIKRLFARVIVADTTCRHTIHERLIHKRVMRWTFWH